MKIHLSALFLIISLFSYSYAFEYDALSDNDNIFYKQNCHAWSKCIDTDKDLLIKKYTQECEKDKTVLEYGNKILKLNSDFECLFGCRFIGINNRNFKFYEVIYEDGEFKEKLLSFEQVENLFENIDVIKISDFKKGVYTIYNSTEGKEILLYNDTAEEFDDYFVTPKECADKNIKSIIKLPRRGNVYLTDSNAKSSKHYLIKVR